MIQRKQTIFLLLAVAVLIVGVAMHTVTPLLSGIEVVAAVVAAVDIFLYKKRKVQALLALTVIALLLVWYLLLAVHAHSQGGDYRLVVADAMPAVAVILTFMARQGILADEKLVRSLDRIR